MTSMIVQATQGRNQEIFLGGHYVIFFFFFLSGGTVFFQIKGGFLLSSLKKKFGVHGRPTPPDSTSGATPKISFHRNRPLTHQKDQ